MTADEIAARGSDEPDWATRERPVDKAEYLHRMCAPALPTFPIGAEIAAQIPHDLPGEVPKTLEEYLDAMNERFGLVRDDG